MCSKANRGARLRLSRYCAEISSSAATLCSSKARFSKNRFCICYFNNETLSATLQLVEACHFVSLIEFELLNSSVFLSENPKIKINKTITLPFELYGCESWSFTLKEKCRLRIFENRILRRIFGPKRDENGEWRRFHNEELHSLYPFI